MRVYVPDKDDGTIAKILKQLYILRQAVKSQTLTKEERVKMIDRIRKDVQDLSED